VWLFFLTKGNSDKDCIVRLKGSCDFTPEEMTTSEGIATSLSQTVYNCFIGNNGMKLQSGVNQKGIDEKTKLRMTKQESLTSSKDEFIEISEAKGVTDATNSLSKRQRTATSHFQILE